MSSSLIAGEDEDAALTNVEMPQQERQRALADRSESDEYQFPRKPGMLRFRHHFSIEPPLQNALRSAKPREFNNIVRVSQKRGLSRRRIIRPARRRSCRHERRVARGGMSTVERSASRRESQWRAGRS
jgi:hypothetical protein